MQAKIPLASAIEEFYMADTASSEPTVEVQETEGKFVAPTAEVVVMEVEPDADNL